MPWRDRREAGRFRSALRRHKFAVPGGPAADGHILGYRSRVGVAGQAPRSRVAGDAGTALLEADGLGGGSARLHILKGWILDEVASCRLRWCGRGHDPAGSVRADYVGRAQILAVHVVDDRLQGLDHVERSLSLSVM